MTTLATSQRRAAGLSVLARLALFALLGMACAVVATPAAAQEWKTAGNPKAGTFFEPASVAAKEGAVYAKIMFDDTRAKRFEGKPYLSDVRYTRFDCERRTVADQKITKYESAQGRGAVVGEMVRTHAEAAAAMKPIEPGTQGDALAQAICGQLAQARSPAQPGK
ncbi:surface-adhesin E family protein [Variovorax sp. IB41]|uniref:surface-adhesin E family protein n=1 Tax=Variovorax sp. IB41 TaxID=2779370 RepID=UPI0018E8AE8B|nr:surface-adhesin E family protein [Variovorax sp. IB41]